MEKPDYIVKKRTEFREKYPGLLSNSYLNTFLVALVFVCSLIYSSESINWKFCTLVILPCAFLYADAVFYVAHRFQQHKKTRFNELAFEMHSARHHREHHNPRLMGKYNFGIATTLFDRIFGTRYPDK